MSFNGDKLKKLRKDNGLSLDNIAQQIGSCKSYVWDIEKGNSEPSGNLVYRLSKALCVDMEYFYNDVDNTKKTLGTLITWISQSNSGILGVRDAKQLLNMLSGTDGLRPDKHIIGKERGDE